MVAFYLLSIVVKTFPIGIAYALWCGFGIVAVAFVGKFLFKQNLDVPAITGIGLIILGAIIINVYSKNLNH